MSDRLREHMSQPQKSTDRQMSFHVNDEWGWESQQSAAVDAAREEMRRSEAEYHRRLAEHHLSLAKGRNVTLMADQTYVPPPQFGSQPPPPPADSRAHDVNVPMSDVVGKGFLGSRGEAAPGPIPSAFIPMPMSEDGKSREGGKGKPVEFGGKSAEVKGKGKDVGKGKVGGKGRDGCTSDREWRDGNWLCCRCGNQNFTKCRCGCRDYENCKCEVSVRCCNMRKCGHEVCRKCNVWWGKAVKESEMSEDLKRRGGLIPQVSKSSEFKESKGKSSGPRGKSPVNVDLTSPVPERQKSAREREVSRAPSPVRKVDESSSVRDGVSRPKSTSESASASSRTIDSLLASGKTAVKHSRTIEPKSSRTGRSPSKSATARLEGEERSIVDEINRLGGDTSKMSRIRPVSRSRSPRQKSRSPPKTSSSEEETSATDLSPDYEAAVEEKSGDVGGYPKRKEG
eukprot:gene176-97_t